MYLSSRLPTTDLGMAISSRQHLLVAPQIDVLARSPDGVIGLCMNCEYGS